MAVGFRIKEIDGSYRVDTTTRIGHPIGYVDTGKSNGSINDPRLSLGGTPLLIAMLPLEGSSYETAPVVTITPTGLSWVFTNSGDIYNGNCRLFYGVA